jgi:hypothetical protein
VWNLIRVRASLRVDKKNNIVRVSGTLPSAALRTSVMEALLAPVAEVKLDTSQLRAGAFVKQARFADAEVLPAFLKNFFTTPEAEFFEADGDTVKIRASATPVMEQEWRVLLQRIAERHEIASDVRVYPSTLMFPGYKPVSQLDAITMENLACTLSTATLSFGYGEFSAQPPQTQRNVIAAQAIIAAGPQAHVVIAAYPDMEGNTQENISAAKKRIDYLLDDLKRRGVPDSQIEGLVLPAGPAPDG